MTAHAAQHTLHSMITGGDCVIRKRDSASPHCGGHPAFRFVFVSPVRPAGRLVVEEVDACLAGLLLLRCPKQHQG